METNNKIRAALEQAKEIARTIYSTSETGSPHEDLAEKIVELAHAALAEPVKNCEVGTPEEQMKRQHDTMCNTTKACPDSDWSCRKCFAVWAQMPYVEKEGDNK